MRRGAEEMVGCRGLLFFLFIIAAYPGARIEAEDYKIAEKVAKLPPVANVVKNPPQADWLVTPDPWPAGVYSSMDAARPEIVMTNGLISRTWRLEPNAATVAYDNLMTNETVIRGVKPEAIIELDGKQYKIGGLEGQVEYGYLRQEWVDALTSDAGAFQCIGFETGEARERLAWKRMRHASSTAWPPPGVSMTLWFRPPAGMLNGVEVSLYFEMYDDLPVMSKKLVIENKGTKPVRLTAFVSEILACVEFESSVGEPGHWTHPNIHVESDYAFLGMTPRTANKTTFWVPDPQYTSQVNYRRISPVMLESRPPIGPNVVIEPGETFESFTTFELIYDATERERKGLALRRMYRAIAPWATENPILMHVRHADPESVRSAVDQCADVGFEMIIMTFGSGFNAESEDPVYIAQIRELVDYAHGRGVELGGYSLLASRRISDEHDVINPKTGKPGGAVFGNSPCLCSEWGREYFRKLKNFIEKTGLDLIEHDGSYPGDVCASTKHPGHEGLEDSQWKQWKVITGFYKWCRERGVYLNVPDWYFLTGSNKNGMGYREVNWSLPRERQIILGRQNIFDGTWYKAPSMGWMFVPLVEYHGGGAAATLEPLSEHLGAYGAHLAQNFGSGVQACYRGPRLYDADRTRDLVKRWVDFYKKYRAILDSDIIHVRRADGRDVDCMLHVNPALKEKGLAVVYNPLDRPVEKTLRLPLYYTGLTKVASIREQEGQAIFHRLDRKYYVELPVNMEPRSVTWFVIE